MDLIHKAAWHVQLNDGFVPLLELPDASILYESRVLMCLANDLGKDQGMTLFEKDCAHLAKQRLAME